MSTTKPDIVIEVESKLYREGCVTLRYRNAGFAYLKSILLEQPEINDALSDCAFETPLVSIQVKQPGLDVKPRRRPLMAILGYFVLVVLLMAFLIGLISLIQKLFH